MRMAAGNASGRARFHSNQDFAAPAFHPAQAEDAFRHIGQRFPMCADGQLVEDGPYQSQRLEDLIEAHRDSGRDIAIAMRGHAHFELVVGRAGKLRPQVPGLRTGASGEPGEAHFRSQLRYHLAAVDEAVLQPGVIVVDGLEHADVFLDHVCFERDARTGLAAEVARHAPRHDRIHQIAVPERRRVGAQPVFLEARELRQAERQPGIVADEAKVAEMIGDPFTLQA